MVEEVVPEGCEDHGQEGLVQVAHRVQLVQTPVRVSPWLVTFIEDSMIKGPSHQEQRLAFKEACFSLLLLDNLYEYGRYSNRCGRSMYISLLHSDSIYEWLIL